MLGSSYHDQGLQHTYLQRRMANYSRIIVETGILEFCIIDDSVSVISDSTATMGTRDIPSVQIQDTQRIFPYL